MTQRAPFSKRTERAILAIICVDLLLQGSETLPAFADFARFFRWAGVGVWLVFSVEFCLRIRRAENWRKYAFSFIGVMDFLAIPAVVVVLGIRSEGTSGIPPVSAYSVNGKDRRTQRCRGQARKGVQFREG